MRLVVIHSQTDAADFASRSPELFREKTLGAVVMGGVVATGLGVEDDGVVPCGALVPDADASNNRADEVAATFFTARCQALGVPMTVISRHLALACRLPRSVYDALGARGGPVGARKPTASSGGPDHTSNLFISVTSESIRLIFGRIESSPRAREAQRKILRRNRRVRSH